MLEFVDLGLVEYSKAHQKQKQFLDDVIHKKTCEKVIFCSHFPIVTYGRRGPESDLTSWKGPTAQVERGGRATYHGPNQIIIYPILDLSLKRKQIKPHNIRSFLNSLEQIVISVLKNEYNLNALGSDEVSLLPSLKPETKGSTEETKESAKKLFLTGVWIGNKKIASIGIALKRWVTYHGIAINLDEDTKAFQGINPCGFRQDVMTSLEKNIGRKVDREKFSEKLKKSCLKAFS